MFYQRIAWRGRFRKRRQRLGALPVKPPPIVRSKPDVLATFGILLFLTQRPGAFALGRCHALEVTKAFRGCPGRGEGYPFALECFTGGMFVRVGWGSKWAGRSDWLRPRNNRGAIGPLEDQPVSIVGVSAHGVSTVMMSMMMKRAKPRKVFRVGRPTVFPMNQVMHFEFSCGAARVTTRRVTIQNRPARVSGNHPSDTTNADGFSTSNQIRVY